MIFVGGIHGVGKTTICKNIERDLAILHLSSSKLIANKKKEIFTDKKIKYINVNQDYLVEALKDYSTQGIDYLLDGHFCLIDNSGSVVKIPLKTFEILNPTAILLIVDTKENIIQRLIKRDGKNYSPRFIDLFQNTEIQHSKEVASLLNIPLYLINTGDHSENINEIVLKLIEKERSS